MCPFVIVVIMIALILFMPAVYAMGVARGITRERNKECLEGDRAVKGIPTTPVTKCTVCAKMKYCMNPSPDMAVFCK